VLEREAGLAGENRRGWKRNQALEVGKAAGRLLGEEARCVCGHTSIAEATGVVVSVRCRRSGKGRGSVAVGFVFQMFEDLCDDTRLGDEGNHAELAATRTEKRVELENSSDQICPPTAQSLFTCWAQGRLVFLSLVVRRIGLLGRWRNLPLSSSHV